MKRMSRPIAISEVARMRTAMGWAVIGSLVTSTLLTLIVVPAIFSYVDRFRIWSKARMAAAFLPRSSDAPWGGGPGGERRRCHRSPGVQRSGVPPDCR